MGLEQKGKQTIPGILNLLTIDVEDYFQVHAFSRVIRTCDWANYRCRVEHNTYRLLEILNNVCPQRALPSPEACSSVPALPMSDVLCPTAGKATFFVLGWIAERYPALIKTIRDAGHEIACHGYGHQLIYRQSKEEFREDVRKAKVILEDITGDEVIGYRAPSYSITKQSRWAFEILMEEGFRYDSSIFPVHHDVYGFPNAPRFPFTISLKGDQGLEFSGVDLHAKFARFPPSGALGSAEEDFGAAAPQSGAFPKKILEFPLSTVRVLGQNIPVSGGGYFRIFPYYIIRKGLRRINEREGKLFTFYLHPWELDPNQPRIDGLSLKCKFRHYFNLTKTEGRFLNLLKEFLFSSIREVTGFASRLSPQNWNVEGRTIGKEIEKP